MAAGDGHTIGLKSDGTLWAWGRNNYGQLGDGTYMQRDDPVQIWTPRTLTVNSNLSNVNVTVSPVDNNGNGNGTTVFTRTYDNNTQVTLTAPSSIVGAPFNHWEKDGVNVGSTNPITVTMDADHTVTAVYASLQTISGKVTCSSVGVDGVSISFTGYASPVTTASDGTYSTTVDYNYSGTATPSKNGCTFTPSSRTYNNVTSSMTGQDYYTACLQAPSVTTGPATNVTEHSATLNGTVNPNGLSTTYYFEWGRPLPTEIPPAVSLLATVETMSLFQPT